MKLIMESWRKYLIKLNESKGETRDPDATVTNAPFGILIVNNQSGSPLSKVADMNLRTTLKDIYLTLLDNDGAEELEIERISQEIDRAESDPNVGAIVYKVPPGEYNVYLPSSPELPVDPENIIIDEGAEVNVTIFGDDREIDDRYEIPESETAIVVVNETRYPIVFTAPWANQRERYPGTGSPLRTGGGPLTPLHSGTPILGPSKTEYYNPEDYEIQIPERYAGVYMVPRKESSRFRLAVNVGRIATTGGRSRDPGSYDDTTLDSGEERLNPIYGFKVVETLPNPQQDPHIEIRPLTDQQFIMDLVRRDMQQYSPT